MTTADAPASKEAVTAALLVMRALAILHEWVKATGAEMNEARLLTSSSTRCRGRLASGSVM